MERVLVTGASGFLGGRVVVKLIHMGYFVVGIDRNSFPFHEILKNKNFRFIHADITNDLVDEITDLKINFIFHFAAKIRDNDMDSFQKFYDANVKPIEVLTRVASMGSVKFFLLASTCSVFGEMEKKTIIDEMLSPNPIDFYGLSKFVAEKVLIKSLEQYDTKVVIYRFTQLFGKDDKYGLINNFVNAVLKSKDIEIFGDGMLFRNFLEVEDAVRVIVQLIISYPTMEKNECFIIGNKESIRIGDLAERIVNKMNSKSRVILFNKCSKFEFDSIVDITKAENMLGFTPKGLGIGIESYLNNL